MEAAVARTCAEFTRRLIYESESARRGGVTRRRRGAGAAGTRPARLYSGTLIYDRSKLRGFTARLYWPAPNAPATPALLPPPLLPASLLVRRTSVQKVHVA